MSATHIDILRHLRSVMAKQVNATLSDQQLLESFLNQRSEAAFAVLVQRHGAMVFGVCRRLLRHTQDAEDAFQATFLALAQQAASIRRRESLGSWLHGVAYRIAEKMKRTATRRAVHEGRLPPRSPGDAMDDLTWRELRAALDEELRRLPEKYRAPLVLCYLEAQTQEEAIRQLGWSKSTFGRRLNRARQLLAQRLTRRGLALPAALTAPLLIDGAATATLPPLLAANTIRAGLALASGQPVGVLASASVVALAESSGKTLLASKAKWALAFLVSATLAAGGVLTHPMPATQSAAPPPTPQLARSASKDKSIEIKGRVLDPEGKPLAGARLFLWSNATRKKADAIVRARTDNEGRFHFPPKPADFDPKGITTLAATADGFGPDWVEITTKNQDAITLRLVEDDVPIRGRIIDLEGKPVANARVRVRWLEQIDLDSWLKKKRSETRYPNLIEPAMLNMPAQAVTGTDGRFQLRGLGRERLVDLVIEGDTIERIYCSVLTRDGKKMNLPKDRTKDAQAIYPATFDHIAAPTKPIIGTVRDKGTGKPLAGIIVMTGRQTGKWIDDATTDEQGRYRIVGCPKQREYSVNAEGRPYFAGEKRNIADTPGLGPLVVDFEMERGIEITGRVFNKATGEPIDAEITYRALMDNPHLKNISGLYQGFRADGRNRTKADGSFFAIGLPGPGYLTVLAYPDDYHKPAPPADWEKTTPYLNTVPQLAHAWARINPSVKDPQSMRCDIALEPAKPIPGQVFGTDGKPSGGFFVAGLTGYPLILTSEIGLHEKSTFQVRGFDAGRPRTLIFIHLEKKLGKVVIVREIPREPLQVRLEPLGSVAGRALDGEGRPRAGLSVRAEINSNGDQAFQRALFLFENGWIFDHHADPAAKTDAGGKFRLGRLMPGLKYTLLVGDDKIENVTVESGKTKDLGDCKSKQ